MIDLIAAAGIGGIIGFGTCACLTAGKIDDVRFWRDFWHCRSDGTVKALDESVAAHTRCADALATKDRKLSAIRDLLDTPRTIRKGDVRDVLDGDV